MTTEHALKLAIEKHQTGHLAEAESIYRQVLLQHPDHADALHLLGVLAWQVGRHDLAEELIIRAIGRNPRAADYHADLGDLFSAKGKWVAAISAYQQAIALRPGHAHAHRRLAFALIETKQLDEAIRHCRAALAVEPNSGEAHRFLGGALHAKWELDEAMKVLEQALMLEPNRLDILAELGNVCNDMGRLREAVGFYERVLEIDPSLSQVDSNRVYSLHFDADYDAPALLREHRLWNQRHADPLKKHIRPHDNDRSPDRRLKIGYVSPDFRNGVVGWNLLPLLSKHDHEQFEIFCYSNLSMPDPTTERLRACSDAWRGIWNIADEQAAEMIRRDRIDILVDLTLHMANNRLMLFARKPAPVQATYLGYCSTTGVETIDYRLSDPYLDPPERDLDGYSEKTVRLPRSYWCYQPGATAPEVSPLPATVSGTVTFGCLNNFAKVSCQAMDLWSQVLSAVPRSRLLLHCLPGSHRQEVLRQFIDRGISSDRLELACDQPWMDYMATYNRIDIALDPLPYGGGITTCDGLWMGVPLVTLSGRTAVGRGGRTILSNIGLPDLVTHSTAEYVRRAVDLAGDLGRLKEVRSSMRERMRASPLMDAGQFARDVEAAYRRMWTDDH